MVSPWRLLAAPFGAIWGPPWASCGGIFSEHRHRELSAHVVCYPIRSSRVCGMAPQHRSLAEEMFAACRAQPDKTRAEHKAICLALRQAGGLELVAKASQGVSRTCHGGVTDVSRDQFHKQGFSLCCYCYYCCY